MNEFKCMFLSYGLISYIAILLAPIKILVFLSGILYFHIQDSFESGQRSQ
jgi:hypothetical protein